MYLQVLASLLFFQSFLSCQSVHENVPPMEANLAVSASQQKPETAAKPTTGIVFQSIDGGQTWQDVSAGLPGDLPVNYFLTQNGEVILGAESGLYRSKSTDTAPVWENEMQLMGQFSGVYPGRTGLYAYSNQDGFFQSISKGTWMPVFTDLKIQSRPFRTIMETLNGTLFIGTDNGIYKSADQGKTWKHVYEDGWMIHMVESDGVLICTNQGGILRSTDQGEHWETVISEGGVGIAVEVIQGGFAAITYNTESKSRRVRISTDAGKTWQAVDAGLPPHANIASIKQLGEYFFCGHPSGIFRSADRGKTWQLILPSIKEKVFNLSVSGQVIYAVPLNGGC
jgi:photosystem II stability/assembly factor-like uncharacterized protein